LSGRYGPSHPKWSQRDDERGSYILGGLHHQAHQTDLRITEHYTDTAGLITAAIDHWNTVYTGSPHDLLKIVR